jgi:hypothetical protein
LAMRLRGLFLICVLGFWGCGGEGQPGALPGYGSGAESPGAAVQELVNHVDAAEFGLAGSLAVRGQPALASLAEGASFQDVAAAIKDEDPSVPANFWSGFAQSSGVFWAGGVATGDEKKTTVDGKVFTSVQLLAEGGTHRTMVTVDDDGWRVDVFASFGAGLAGRMVGPVERLLVTNSEDARLILSTLQTIVPSLDMALELPELTPELGQDVLRLIEVITRAS